MKMTTVSMICAGMMTMGGTAIAAEPAPQEGVTLLAMSHEGMEKDHDGMGHDDMGKDEMGHDGMDKDEMGHDGMDKDEMGQ